MSTFNQEFLTFMSTDLLQ